METQSVEHKIWLQQWRHNMALKDLKSDLTKAFKRIPAGGKLEKRVEGPTASNYSAKPKPYKIPNDGRGSKVKYNSSNGAYEAKSRFNEVQNKSQISGRHTSDIEPVKSNLNGRHENVDIKLNNMATTPEKTAVEPIAMSATPVKQGLTPKVMSAPVNQPGITPEKIAIKGYVDNQPPNIDNVQYSLDIGDGALAQLEGLSRFDIDKISDSYYTSGMFKSDFFITRNNKDILKVSELDVEKESQPYAPSGYMIDRLSRYFTPIRDAIDLDKEFGIEKSNNMQLTGEIDSFNPTIQIHGSNITTPYDLDLKSVLESDSVFIESDVKSAYTDTDDLRFFSDHAKVDLDNMVANHSPSADNPNNGAFTLDNQLNSIHGGFHAYGNQTQPIDYNLNFFNAASLHGTDFQGNQIILTGNSKIDGDELSFNPEGVKDLIPFPNTLKLNDQIGEGTSLGGVNMFVGRPQAERMVFDSTSGVTIKGFEPSSNPNVGNTIAPGPGYSGGLAMDHPGTSFYFLDIDNLTTGNLYAKGRLGFDTNNSAVFRNWQDAQNFFNQDNPIMSNGFTPQFNGTQLVLTGPSWDWILGNVELTGHDWIQNGDDNPSIFSINCTLTDETINYFDIDNEHYQGYINYNNDGAYFAMTGGWNNWQHSDIVTSLYTGINGTSYDNPSIYFDENSTTNYFDQNERYTSQFTLNKLGYEGGTENSDYVNVGDGVYDGINIHSTNSDYSFSSLFNNQLNYWNLGTIDYLGDVDTSKYASSGLHPDPDTSAGVTFSGYTDETTGAFNHEINSAWPYYTMIGIDNSTWGSGIGNFRPNLNGAIPPTVAMVKDKSLYRYLDNGMSSWMITATELGGDEYESVEDNLIFNHPDHKPDISTLDGMNTYGYGLGISKHLRYWSNSILVGSGKFSKNIAFRNPMGKKHITYLEGDQLLISKDNNWLDKAYEWGPSMYGTKVGLSSGGIMGISTGRNPRAGDLWLQAFDLDNQVFTSNGAGIHTMGGIGYEERMINIYNENTQQRSMAGSILNNLNPFDNMKSIFDNMSVAFNDTIKRWWMQHNRFAIQMSNNPPKGSHQGLPGDSATGAVGKFSGMLNSVSTGGADLISNITGLSARKYWSVQSYPGLQVSAEIVDTGITRFNDFRMFISDMGAAHVGLSGPSNYLNNNIHKRYGYPASGTPGLDRKMYYKHIPAMGDDITMEDFYTGDEIDIDAPLDYINFFMKDVVNDHKFRFRAYISGLTDSVQPNWSQYNYIGRPDPVFQYNGVSARNLSFNLKVAALAQQDMYWMWKKINKMIGMCYPSGYQNGGFMTSPMMELTLGEYVENAPCFLNAFTLSVPDDSPWEINQMAGSGGPFSSLGDSIATVTNVMNDPLGSAVNFGASFLTNDEDPIPARKNNKNYAFNEFDANAHETSGTLLAQLPHIVDLSLGFTIIGDQNKSTLSKHIGNNKQFFDGYGRVIHPVNTSGPGTKAGKVMDFLGL